MGASLKGKQGDLGPWWVTRWGLCQEGPLCAFSVYCVTLFPTPRLLGWAPPSLFPHPKPSLIIKFSIFGGFGFLFSWK